MYIQTVLIVFKYSPSAMLLAQKYLQTSTPLVQTLNAPLPFEATTTCVGKLEDDNEIEYAKDIPRGTIAS